MHLLCFSSFFVLLSLDFVHGDQTQQTACILGPPQQDAQSAPTAQQREPQPVFIPQFVTPRSNNPFDGQSGNPTGNPFFVTSRPSGYQYQAGKTRGNSPAENSADASPFNIQPFGEQFFPTRVNSNSGQNAPTAAKGQSVRQDQSRARVDQTNRGVQNSRPTQAKGQSDQQQPLADQPSVGQPDRGQVRQPPSIKGQNDAQPQQAEQYIPGRVVAGQGRPNFPVYDRSGYRREPVHPAFEATRNRPSGSVADSQRLPKPETSSNNRQGAQGGPQQPSENINALRPQLSPVGGTVNRSPVLLAPQGTVTRPRQDQLQQASTQEVLGRLRFYRWLQKSGFMDVLNNTRSNYTIVLPTDKAVNKLPLKYQQNLEQSSKQLEALLMYHIIPGVVNVTRLNDEDTIPTVSGKDIRFNKYTNDQTNDTLFTVSGAPIVGRADLEEGRIQFVVVDRVMYPPQGTLYEIVSKSPILRSLTNLVNVANLQTELAVSGPFTLFAPSDEAFNKLSPESIGYLSHDADSSRAFLLRHIVRPLVFTTSIPMGNSSVVENTAGERLEMFREPDRVKIDGVGVIYADITATNGVIHVIDHVL